MKDIVRPLNTNAGCLMLNLCRPFPTCLADIVFALILFFLGSLCPQIRVIERAQEIPHEGVFCDLVWSDPEEIDSGSWAQSPRGAGYLFGHKVTSEFNHINGLHLICRAHQLVQEGYKYMFPAKNLVTVWSAPNYCYRCGNVAAILSFDDKLERCFKIFREVPEAEYKAQRAKMGGGSAAYFM
mgnify:CR=1 FL=1